MKNKRDRLFFTQLFVPQASQSSYDRRTELEVLFAIPSAQSACGMESSMEEDYKIIDHYLMIRLPEEIDHHSCSVICRRADHMMLDNSVSHIVFDFSDTKFMDSSGIGVLAGRYRKISCFGGKVYVIHANRRIRKILEMSGIGDIVEMIDQGKD